MQGKFNKILWLAILSFLFQSVAFASATTKEAKRKRAEHDKERRELSRAEIDEKNKKNLRENISVVSAKARPSISGSNNSAAYITIKNNNKQDLVILAAMAKKNKDSAGSLANTVEMHMIVTDNQGVSRMVKVDRLLVPKESELVMKPHGVHIMLIDLKKPLNYGDKIYADLIFEEIGLYQVEVTVGNVNS